MIATKKKFDCVQMKWDIQQALREEYAGLSAQERRRLQEERILENPVLSKFLKKTVSSG